MENKRHTAIEISKTEFKKAGYQLIDSIADFFDSIDERPVTTGESPKQLQSIFGAASLPENGKLYSEYPA